MDRASQPGEVGLTLNLGEFASSESASCFSFPAKPDDIDPMKTGSALAAHIKQKYICFTLCTSTNVRYRLEKCHIN